MKTKIRAVTFDVGGTLIRPWPSVGQVYADEAGRHGWPSISPDILDRNFRTAWHGREGGFNHSERDWATLVDATFSGLVDPPPSRSFFPALYERFTRAEVWRIFDDVFPVLQRLQGTDLRLMVVSNWDARLRPLLLELGLTDFFDDLLISLEIGSAKPDARIFLEAARRLGVRPPEILHVGDDPEADTEGAQQAGLQARTIVRHARRAVGTHDICSLTELIPLTEV